MKERIIKISSGGLDFEYEIGRTNAPDNEIIEAIIIQETDPNGAACRAGAYETLEEKGYTFEVLDSDQDDAEDRFEVEAEFDISDIIDEHCEEVVENGVCMYKRRKRAMMTDCRFVSNTEYGDLCTYRNEPCIGEECEIYRNGPAKEDLADDTDAMRELLRMMK